MTDDPNIQVQTVANSNQVIFKTQTLDLEKREAFAKYMADEFGVEEKDITTENISSTVSSEMRVDAIIAVPALPQSLCYFISGLKLKISGLRQVQ